jgi:hypothetical protein
MLRVQSWKTAAYIPNKKTERALSVVGRFKDF